MKAGIITIGDEILLGQTLDTNSNWIASRLTELGIEVNEIISISDQKKHILNSLERTSNENDFVFITGGLGPTNDDITKKSIAEFTNTELEWREDIFERLKNYFAGRNPELIEKNRDQAYLPKNCEAIENRKGTASGMWISYQNTILISMPGVPGEMRGMMKNVILDKIRDRFDVPNIIFKQALTANIPEALLSDKLQDFEKQLPSNIKLAYLPDLGRVKLRLTARGDDRSMLEQQVDKELEKIKSEVGKYIYGYNNDTLAGKLGLLLMNEQKKVSTAESCTGGYIAHEITTIPGSSAFYNGSVIAYSNEVKRDILNVKSETLEKYGAVSEQTVEEMVAGLLEITKADFGIAVSGIAGPTGGTKSKPVGTVCISVGNKDQLYTKRYQLLKNRMINIKLTSTIALENMRKFLKQQIGNAS